MPRRRKAHREKDLTRRYADGEMEEDRLESGERFGSKSKGFQQGKIERTAVLRAADGVTSEEIDTLPSGQVTQVYSLFVEVESAGVIHLAVVRKTLTKLARTAIVVGDRVRLRLTGSIHESGRPEAVIEQILPRSSLLTRAGSFGHDRAPSLADSQMDLYAHPIVANADQLLIVASVIEPRVKWGLLDRSLLAARGGNLHAIVCLNKIDLASRGEQEAAALADAVEHLAHYRRLGLDVLETSADAGVGLDALREKLHRKVTVLAGHSGVGKSSLINAIEPGLDLRVGVVSVVTEKGRHTTTSARRYPLSAGGAVVDTPGVKQFGLWGVTGENLDDFFQDVHEGTAPGWRVESYRRIAESVGKA